MTDGGPDSSNPEDLVELVPLLDVYADGIAMVEPVYGDNWRITYYTCQRLPGSTRVTRVIVAKIVRPRTSLEVGQIASMIEKWTQDRAQMNE